MNDRRRHNTGAGVAEARVRFLMGGEEWVPCIIIIILVSEREVQVEQSPFAFWELLCDRDLRWLDYFVSRYRRVWSLDISECCSNLQSYQTSGEELLKILLRSRELS